VWVLQPVKGYEPIAGSMRVAGYEFEYVGDIEPLQGAEGVVSQFAPQGLYKNVRNVLLNKYGAGPFCKFKITNRFQTSGVYIIAAGTGIRYVGECANLSARFNAGYGNISPKNCFKGGQETNCRLNNLIYLATVAGERMSLWFFRTTDYKLVESELKQLCNPPWNRG
jgi:hypothetical protein